MENINKISVVGGSGCGKTVLTNNLSKVLKLPVYHLDGINYDKDWVQIDKNIRDTKIRNIIKEDKWIVDGSYKSTMLERFEAADLIIYLDYSTIAQLKGVMNRFFKNHGKEKEEIPGCKERMNWTFFKFVITWRKKKRENILKSLDKIENKDKIIIFKNRKELNKWFKREFGKNIEI